MELTNGLLFFGISLWECHFSGRPSQALQLSELLDRKLGFCSAYILYTRPKRRQNSFFVFADLSLIFWSWSEDTWQLTTPQIWPTGTSSQGWTGIPVPVHPRESRSQILGSDFFILFPFPNFGKEFLSFHIRSRISFSNLQFWPF